MSTASFGRRASWRRGDRPPRRNPPPASRPSAYAHAMRIRPARLDDIDAVVAFTTDTFPWGDYVPDMFARWLTEDAGITMVAVDDDDVPIAMARAVFLTEHEVWSHAARVHPDHRGRGIAGDLADSLLDWATDHGGQVMRLLIDDDNLASIRHITKKGFRRPVSVVRATRGIGAGSPNPEGNGGRRPPSPLAPRPAKVRDLPLVRASWSTSEVGRSMRGLIGAGWRFHRLRDADIEQAARSGNLWEIGNSWAITGAVEPTFEIHMLDTAPEEAYDVIRALIDTANNRGADALSAWLADTDWLVQAARRAGCDVTGHGVWEKPLDPR
jgi:GNAT superfamily N-acetyltransferase